MADNPEAPVASGASPETRMQAPGAHPDLPSTSLTSPPSPPQRSIVSSASELPTREIKAAVFNQHVASDQYVEHHRKAMESLRESHRNERAAWYIERGELHAKIADLETKFKRISSAVLDAADGSSIQDKLKNFSLGSKTAFRSSSTPGDFASAATSRHYSVGSLGGRFDGSDASDATKHGMASIPEERDSDRNRSVSFAAGGLSDADINRQLKGITVPINLIDKELDGVKLKATGLSPTTKKAIVAESHTGTPSPMVSSPSPTKRRDDIDSPGPKEPITIAFPSTKQTLQLPAKDLKTYAAGNTPLARMADEDDEGTGTSTTSGGATPKGSAAVHTAEQERPPLEPYPSTFDGKPLRPPNERSDSYFNVPTSGPKGDENKTEDDIDEDPALKGELTLPSHPPPPATAGNSGEFLDKLDKKLENISRQQNRGNQQSPPAEGSSATENAGMNDPPLRMRSSINFGSRFGHDPRS